MLENKQEKTMYLISWSDDNYVKFFWLNKIFLGVETETIIDEVFHLGQQTSSSEEIKIKSVAVNAWSFPEEIAEDLCDYFQYLPTFDDEDIRLIAKAVDNSFFWYSFYEKNVKKVKSKG